MCLAILEDKKPCRTGYKVMHLSSVDGKLYGEIIRVHKDRPMGVWLHEEDYRSTMRPTANLVTNSKEHYPLGWHVLHTLADARTWRVVVSHHCIVKVKVRKPRTVGRTLNYQITVCKEIKITKIIQGGNNGTD